MIIIHFLFKWQYKLKSKMKALGMYQCRCMHRNTDTDSTDTDLTDGTETLRSVSPTILKHRDQWSPTTLKHRDQCHRRHWNTETSATDDTETLRSMSPTSLGTLVHCTDLTANNYPLYWFNPVSPGGTHMSHFENFLILEFFRILEKYFQ